eukprot:SAG31_NODE_1356_length_8657_cov_4.678546_6_plen_231_part_00
MQLVEELGLLHRATALTMKGLRDGFHFSYTDILKRNVDMFNMYTCDEDPDTADVTLVSCNSTAYYGQPLFADLKESHFPCAVDAIKYRHVVHKMVKNYLKIYYADDDSLVDDVNLMKFWKTSAASHVDIDRDGIMDRLELCMDECIKSSTGGVQMEIVCENRCDRQKSGRDRLRSREQLWNYITEFIVAVTAHHTLVGSVGECKLANRLAAVLARLTKLTKMQSENRRSQ